MNRLAPLITRSAPPQAAIRARALPRADWTAARLLETAPGLAEDFKLFATAWLGGLVFFGTLLA
jgi:hypothetical protein